MSDNDAEAIMNKTPQAGMTMMLTAPLQMLQMQQGLVKQQVELGRSLMRMNPFLAPFV